MSTLTQPIAPQFIQITTTHTPIVNQLTDLKYSSSTENLLPNPSAPPVQVTSPRFLNSNSAEVAPIQQDTFYSLLSQAAKEVDPFVALTKHFADKEGYWTCIFQLDKGAHIECQLAWDTWSSTCFDKMKPGNFRYIDLYEHNTITATSDNKPLVSIRISEDHKEGEWLWINRSISITGRQAIHLGEKISRAMKIEKCFLADTAKVKASDGISEIAILVPQQIIQGHGYYAPLFTLFDTNKTTIKSPITISGFDKKLTFYQNPKTHQKDLTWLQALKIDALYSDILKHRKEDRQAFASLLKRTIPELNQVKVKLSTSFLGCTWTLQKLISCLYSKRHDSPQALLDYEWIYFHLLETPLQTCNTPIQQKYAQACRRLFANMLMHASFA